MSGIEATVVEVQSTGSTGGEDGGFADTNRSGPVSSRPSTPLAKGYRGRSRKTRRKQCIHRLRFVVARRLSK